MEINYKTGKVSNKYRCEKCERTGIKLWRKSRVTSDNIYLLCAKCVGEDQKVDVSQMRPNGTVYDKSIGWIDQIGIYIPAVPDEEGVSFWGYTSVPEAGVKWWQRLPN